MFPHRVCRTFRQSHEIVYVINTFLLTFGHSCSNWRPARTETDFFLLHSTSRPSARLAIDLEQQYNTDVCATRRKRKCRLLFFGIVITYCFVEQSTRVDFRRFTLNHQRCTRKKRSYATCMSSVWRTCFSKTGRPAMCWWNGVSNDGDWGSVIFGGGGRRRGEDVSCRRTMNEYSN